MINLPQPDYATGNLTRVGYSDQGGRCDGVQIMVQDGYAYIGHIFSKGFSVIDVRDPRNPAFVRYVPAPPNTWTLHLQAHDGLLLVVHNKDMFAQPELVDEKNYYKGPRNGWTHGRTGPSCCTPPTSSSIATRCATLPISARAFPSSSSKADRSHDRSGIRVVGRFEER